MKQNLLLFAAAAFMFAACSDDSSIQSSTDKTSKVSTSCKFDDSWLEEASANGGFALKKMVYEESAGEREPERSFYVVDQGDSVLFSVTGIVEACNKMVRDIGMRMEGDTLYATLNYEPDVTANCLCFWVDMSFTAAKKYGSAKTLVIGNEVFPLHELSETTNESLAIPPEENVTSGKAVFKGSSCEFDETLLNLAGAAKSLKKTGSEEKFGEKAPGRAFYVEESESSVEVSVTGLVSACNKVIKGVDVRVEGDTLYATVDYMPDAETLCLCTWVDLSFTVDKALLSDSVKTLVIGEEVFTLREKAESSSEE